MADTPCGCHDAFLLIPAESQGRPGMRFEDQAAGMLFAAFGR